MKGQAQERFKRVWWRSRDQEQSENCLRPNGKKWAWKSMKGRIGFSHMSKNGQPEVFQIIKNQYGLKDADVLARIVIQVPQRA